MTYLFSMQNQSPWLVDVYNKYIPWKPDGFLVEFGVGHAVFGSDYNMGPDTTLRGGSNTADLLDLGWSGLYVEPVAEYCEEARLTHAHNLDRLTIVKAAAGCENKTSLLYLGDSLVPNDLGNSWDGPGSRGYDWIGREISVRVSSEIMEEANVPSYIDLMSIDVEGYEESVLRGIDFNIYCVSVLVCEINAVPPEKIASLLPEMYVMVARDELNGVWINKDTVK